LLKFHAPVANVCEVLDKQIKANKKIAVELLKTSLLIDLIFYPLISVNIVTAYHIMLTCKMQVYLVTLSHSIYKSLASEIIA